MLLITVKVKKMLRLTQFPRLLDHTVDHDSRKTSNPSS